MRVMSTLDNFALDNAGTRSFSRLWMPVRGLGLRNALVTTDCGGAPGRWDIANSMPLAPIQPVDPFSRMQYGLDVPNRMIRDFRTCDPLHNPYVPVVPETRLVPGGEADSYILYQTRSQPSVARMPYSLFNRFNPYAKRCCT